MVVDELHKYVRKELNESFLFDKIFRLLNEEYHEMTNFNLFILNIVRKIINQKRERFYTGWNWFIEEHQCFRVNNEYRESPKIYNKNIGYPIYIDFYNENDGMRAYVLQRTEEYNITIFLNVQYIPDDIRNSTRMTYFNYVLKHELTHIRLMYSHIDFNPLTSLKNIGDNILLDEDFKDFSKGHLLLIRKLFYYISPTEQDSHLNEYIQFLKDFDYNELYDIPTINDKISFLIKRGDIHTNLCDYMNIYENLFMMNHSIINVEIAYLLYKYNFIKCNVPNEILIKIKLRTFRNSEVPESITTEAIDFIQSNLDNYKKRIYDVTYKFLKEKAK